MRKTFTLGAAAVLTAAGAATAQDIQVTIENLQESGGFSLTPFWVALHNGGFDSYDAGVMASAFPGLEELAEDGVTGPIMTAFANSPAGMAGGVDTTLVNGNAAPVFSPGESQTFSLNAGDSTVNRYFSYASMVVPSNDLFVANGNPFAIEVFAADGSFNGPVTIDIFGMDVVDAGTEVNNAFGGAAFSLNGGDPVDENGLIRDFFTEQGDQAYLDSFIGTQTADGNTIERSFGRATLLGRITIVPAPGAGALALIGLAGVARRRR